MNKENATVFTFSGDVMVVSYTSGDFNVCNENGIQYFYTFEDLKEKHPEYSREIDNALKEKENDNEKIKCKGGYKMTQSDIMERVDTLELCREEIEVAHEFDESPNWQIAVIDKLIKKYGDDGLRCTLSAFATYVEKKRKYFSSKGENNE